MNGNLITFEVFGERMSTLRIKAGYSIPRELALVLCGYPKDTTGLMGDEAKKVDRMRRNIQNWENGKNMPNAHMIAKICNLLDCDPDYFLYLEADCPRREVKKAAEVTGLTVHAIESLAQFSKVDTLQKPTFMQSGQIISLLLDNPKFYIVVKDILSGIKNQMSIESFHMHQVIRKQAKYNCAETMALIEELKESVEDHGYTLIDSEEMRKVIEFQTNQHLSDVVRDTITVLYQDASTLLQQVFRECQCSTK